jgi:hypothetical protein
MLKIVQSLELELRPSTIDALRAEVPNLLKRRAFVVGAECAEMRRPCGFSIVHPVTGARLLFPAEVVWAETSGPRKGVGVELRAVDPDVLTAFVENAAGSTTSATPSGDGREKTLAENEPDAGERAEGDGRAKTLYEKVRGFSAREREACARSGVLPERIALERCYGASVWEGIVQNPQVTPPEVARIARNGTIPKSVLGIVVANAGWLSVGEVQRALLSNPRVKGAELDRVLRALAPAELRRVAQQTSYGAAVRQAAQRLVK